MYFEIILVSPQARGLKEGRTEVKIKMRSLLNDGSCLFGRNDFLDRKYRMQEMYQNFIEGELWDTKGVRSNVLASTLLHVHMYMHVHTCTCM